VLAHLGDLDVHLRDQGTRGVEHAQAPRIGLRAHRLRHAVRREHDRRAARHLVQLLDEDRALGLEVVDDEFVVDHLVPHVDRGAELRERLLDDGDGAVDAGAEAAGVGEKYVHGQSRSAAARD
jgi:hypothetical protein